MITNLTPPIYVLASNYQIAKSIFVRFFGRTGKFRRIDFRFVDGNYKLYGVRDATIIVSNERYPSREFYEKLSWIMTQKEYRRFNIIYESDLEKEQVGEEVSG